MFSYMSFSFFDSTNIVRPSIVSLNSFFFSNDGINCSSEFFNIDLEKFNNVGFIILVKKSCKNIIIRDIRNIRFTIKILFKPDVQRAISSLSFSNLGSLILMLSRKRKELIL